MGDNSAGIPASLDGRSRYLRKCIVRMLEAGGRGHMGAAFSLVEIIRVLYDDVLRFDPKRPDWKGRDRFILSKGHGCLALYSVLADKGFFPETEFSKFCKSDGILGGHPEHGKVPGVEASTGSLGHGLSIGVGFTLSARHDGAGHKVVVVIGDGESNEGSIWEAALSAGKHKLSNLTVVVDYNKQQACGSILEVQDMEPFADKWKSFGFACARVDGHDVHALRSVFSRLPLDPSKPTAILCDTVKGKGIPFAEHNPEWHHKNKLSPEDIRSLLAALGAD
ncbi:MAG: transketolase [Elusimicrobia bacterium]|nr:transketolase [Elusimicrobiota bacterium]